MRIRNFLFALIIVVGQIIQVNGRDAKVIKIEGKTAMVQYLDGGGTGMITVEDQF